VASRTIPFLMQNAAVSGVLYGVAVYFFMNRIVVPLSAAAKRPFSLKFMIVGIVIHIFCVGLPISLSVRRFSK
jgi:phage shock protein PspC (stress-responsive transcriptional regulator)